MPRFGQDLRYGFRVLRSSPAFTAVAVLTLALGVGANTVVFSILNALFLRTAPVHNPGELVMSTGTHRGVSLPEYRYYRDNNRSFAGLAAEYPTAHAYLQTKDDSEIVLGAIVTANYFDLLGVKPFLGRLFIAADDQVGAAPVVVLSYPAWRERFAADPELVGKTIRLNGVSLTVVGVAPAGFHRLFSGFDNDLWLPSSAASFIVPHCNPADYKCDFFNGVIGRLKPGMDLSSARNELNRLDQQWESVYPDLAKSIMRLYPARGIDPANRLEIAHLPSTLVAIVAVLLLIACANVSGLLLARGTVRRKEIATRLALGATRARIIRQLMTEAAMLVLLGTGLGALLLVWASRWLSNFPFVSTEGFRSFYQIGFDRRVFIATAALSVISVFLFGLLPALRASRTAPMETLKEAGALAGRQQTRSRALLVATQVALAMLLSTGAILIVRSLNRVLIGPGVDPDHVAIIRMSPYRLGYPPAKSAAIQAEAVTRIANLPGVVAVSFGQLMPWWESWEDTVALPGREGGVREMQLRVHYNSVAPNYLRTLGIPLLRGREFTSSDRKGSPNVVVVNESLAARLWPTGDAVGQTLLIGGTPCAVVGVARDAQYNPATDGAHLFFYRPYWQTQNNGDWRFVVRTASNAGAMLAEIKQTLRNIDSNVPIGEDSSMRQVLLNDFGPLRLTRVILVFAGFAAVLLSAVGLYGVLAFLVATRTREIGIRLALGAQREQILRSFLVQGLKLALIGDVAGAVIAVFALRILSALLYGVTATDPLTLAAVWVLLLLIGTLASYVPAWRATKVDPISSLRYE
ncbi:MAG TPA: ABC transporter permease [Terriglobales bacterium]|nr:ABC transporter permease [Terriglobales bacterium]